ncbi:hypothetical protein PVAP13_1NG114119 [Panicum virgatum]|uniref:Uncharacterized protein n=1 Tax=Panicum virgatum TaxID=38727 RepID=A0A8T0WIT2_PANVG|nr:hypothetical protein PVAP13_1NG114119 [Panicum virgatum]
MNIPQPIDHQCVVAQLQLATDQQGRLAIGREDVELEEIPADDNDKVEIHSILCPCIGKESEKCGFEISRADKTQSAIKMEISVQPVSGYVVEVNGQKETPLALTYEEAMESVAIDRKIAKAEQKMICQIIYSLPGRIAQESRLLGYYFSWDPGGRSYACSSDHQPMTLFFFQSIEYRLVTYDNWILSLDCQPGWQERSKILLHRAIRERCADSYKLIDMPIGSRLVPQVFAIHEQGSCPSLFQRKLGGQKLLEYI